jgi:hypothetical protein
MIGTCVGGGFGVGCRVGWARECRRRPRSRSVLSFGRDAGDVGGVLDAAGTLLRQEVVGYGQDVWSQRGDGGWISVLGAGAVCGGHVG